MIFLVIKSDSANVGKAMRWIFVRRAVNLAMNFCRKCSEIRWIFLRNAVKGGELFLRNAVKCSEIFFHRIHRISYKNSPQKLQPGIVVFIMQYCVKGDCHMPDWSFFHFRDWNNIFRRLLCLKLTINDAFYA